MHGLINRALEMFVRDTYGRKAWHRVAKSAGVEGAEFEAMLQYPDALTKAVLHDVAAMLDRSQDEVLEDMGTYLVSHPSAEAVRRLLRFSGANFTDFLHSLGDLPARARLAVADLYLPEIELREHNLQLFSVIICDQNQSALAFGRVLIGLLRAMADDFGALVLMDHKGGQAGWETIEVNVLDVAFSEGRSFSLGVEGR